MPIAAPEGSRPCALENHVNKCQDDLEVSTPVTFDRVAVWPKLHRITTGKLVHLGMAKKEIKIPE
jgi:hypothetical protein